MLGIVAVGVVRESRKYSGHPCIGRMGALRGHLCDSTAFLSFIFTRFRDIAAFVPQNAIFPTPPLVFPKFHHVPLGVGGSPFRLLASKSEGVG